MKVFLYGILTRRIKYNLDIPLGIKKSNRKSKIGRDTVVSVLGHFGVSPTHITTTSNLPVEAMENEYPLIVKGLEFIPDSGGLGRFRGGLGIRKEIQVVGHDCYFASHGDRQHIPPWGLFGGQSGRCGRMVIRRKEGPETMLPSGKNSDIHLEDGDSVIVETPGGGGWGDPEERPIELVERDLKDEKYSASPL